MAKKREDPVLLWKGETYAVERIPGSSYYNRGTNYIQAETRVCLTDLDFSSSWKRRKHVPHDRNPPKEIRGRAAKEQIEALIAWAKHADANEAARVQALCDAADRFQIDGAREIIAAQAALEARGRWEREDRCRDMSSNGKRMLVVRGHLHLANGVRCYLEVNFLPEGTAANVGMLAWKHPRLEGVGLEQKLDFLATLPT